MRRRIYVASSWRNQRLDVVIEGLRYLGHEVYDFRADEGFAWSQIDPEYETAGFEAKTPVHTYLRLVEHDIARAGFARDLKHMEWADTFVMVLPCGKSAHLETGWAAGRDLDTYVLLEDPMQPELMYGLLGTLCADLPDLLGVIGTAEEAAA
jgi:hypothetical protein